MAGSDSRVTTDRLGIAPRYISILDVRERIKAVNFDSIDFNIYGKRAPARHFLIDQASAVIDHVMFRVCVFCSLVTRPRCGGTLRTWTTWTYPDFDQKAQRT